MGERWERIDNILHAAQVRPVEARDAFVREACADDAALAEEVLSILKHEASARRFLEPADEARPLLKPGQRLGRYTIGALIGRGGMGEVYRARDSRPPRDLAIKVLPPEFAKDPDRLRRFQHEARAVAALNHPNIVTLYSIEEADGLPFLTLELVDGKTLTDLIPRDGLLVDRLLEIAVPLADAMGAAHARGIVHRDLKPDNIKITPEGRVKVLDFGLAKLQPVAMKPDSTTVTAPAGSVQGQLLGTVAYMSPEQAEGREVDHRSDIFSLGVLLYEMATGQRPFAGETNLSLLSAILKDTPRALADVKPGLPEGLARVVRRCLAKDPGRRYQSAIDVRNELEELRDALQTREPVSRSDRVRRFSTWTIITASIVLAAAAGVLYLASRWRGDSPLRTFHPFATAAGVEGMPAWSPDGGTLAYAAEINGYYQILLRRDDASDPTPVPLTKLDADCLFPAWHPSGTRILFLLARIHQHGEVWVVDVAGGEPRPVVADVAMFAVAPVTGEIAFLRSTTEGMVLWRADSSGGDPRRLGTADRRLSPNTSLGFSPDGRWLGILSYGLLLVPYPFEIATFGKSRWVSFSELDFAVNAYFYFAWMPDSEHVVLNARGDRGTDPQLWMGDIRQEKAYALNISQDWEIMPSISRNGRLALTTTPMDWDIVQIPLTSPTLRPLIADTRYDGWPAWVDNNALVFSTQRSGRFELWRRNLSDGESRVLVTPDMFLDGPTLFLVEPAVSFDGSRLAYTRYSPGIRIYLQRPGGQPIRLTDAAAGEGREDNPAWSPDSRWVLFRRANRIEKAQAIGQATPVPLTKDSVGADDDLSAEPKWAHGDQIVYVSPGGLRRMTSSGGRSETLTARKPLAWDVARDGRMAYGIFEGPHRSMQLTRIDLTSGSTEIIADLGRLPATPDPIGYRQTLRALRVSPDGTRLVLGYLNPRSDIYVSDTPLSVNR